MEQSGDTTLTISRIHHYRDTIRAYTVYVDGERIGRVMDDGEQRFILSPGRRTVKIRLMWISCPTVEVPLDAGTDTRLRCGPNGGILQAWRLFFKPSTAIFIERDDEAGGAPADGAPADADEADGAAADGTEADGIEADGTEADGASGEETPPHQT